ncbi:hypothetical protein [Massilia sp. 9096]|uniref:hypothetical protein n=1 Tax=Massilia sp. 9096 TaxID=1500894 RepID=UPI0035A620B5
MTASTLFFLSVLNEMRRSRTSSKFVSWIVDWLMRLSLQLGIERIGAVHRQNKEKAVTSSAIAVAAASIATTCRG